MVVPAFGAGWAAAKGRIAPAAKRPRSMSNTGRRGHGVIPASLPLRDMHRLLQFNRSEFADREADNDPEQSRIANRLQGKPCTNRVSEPLCFVWIARTCFHSGFS